MRYPEIAKNPLTAQVPSSGNGLSSNPPIVHAWPRITAAARHRRRKLSELSRVESATRRVGGTGASLAVTPIRDARPALPLTPGNIGDFRHGTAWELRSVPICHPPPPPLGAEP
ncbi:hypothetical protein ACFPRL_23785 [Pseudoclavibacter helvolus]